MPDSKPDLTNLVGFTDLVKTIDIAVHAFKEKVFDYPQLKVITDNHVGIFLTKHSIDVSSSVQEEIVESMVSSGIRKTMDSSAASVSSQSQVGMFNPNAYPGTNAPRGMVPGLAGAIPPYGFPHYPPYPMWMHPAMSMHNSGYFNPGFWPACGPAAALPSTTATMPPPSIDPFGVTNVRTQYGLSTPAQASNPNYAPTIPRANRVLESCPAVPPVVVGVSQSETGTGVSTGSELTDLDSRTYTSFAYGRYTPIEVFDACLVGVTFDAAFRSAIESFSDHWKCKNLPYRATQAQLLVPTGVRRRPRTVSRAGGTMDHTLNCRCACGQEPTVIQVYHEGAHVGDGTFRIRVDRSKKTQVIDHFLPDTYQAFLVPDNLKAKVQELLFSEPFLSPSEVLCHLLNSQGNNQDWLPWLKENTVSSHFGFVMRFLNYEVNEATKRLTVDHSTGSLPIAGNSLHSFVSWVQNKSVLRHTPSVNGPSQFPFPTYGAFLRQYSFTADDQVLTIPVWPSHFPEGSFRPNEITEATVSIIFFTPSQLWAVHQVIHSESHKHTLVWVIDGCFKFVRSKKGEGCLITLGFINVEVNRRGFIQRSFVPTCSVVSVSESAASTFAAVKVYFDVLCDFVGFTTPTQPVFSKDLSQGFHAGISKLFPQYIPVSCAEHVRAMIKRQKGKTIPHSLYGRVQYDMHLLHLPPNSVSEANMTKIALQSWKRCGLEEFAVYYEKNHMRRDGVNNNPVTLRFSAAGIPGIANDSQSIESYLGILTGSARLQRNGVVKRNQGIQNFLKTGIYRLSSHNSSLCSRKVIGRWTRDFIHRIPPRVLVIRAVLLSLDDVRKVTTATKGGYLVNATHSIGRTITQEIEDSFFHSISNSIGSDFEWDGGLTSFVERVSSICWVRTLSEFLEVANEESNQRYHHLKTAEVPLICTCREFWMNLTCPSILKVLDMGTEYVGRKPLADLLMQHHMGRSENNRTPNRRRAPLPPRRPPHEAMLDYFGLPYDYRNSSLEFIKDSTVQQLERSLKARRVKTKICSKMDKVASLIAGTQLGEDVSNHILSIGHPFAAENLRARNRQQRGRITAIGPPYNADVSYLINPFPEGSDDTPGTECRSYFTKLESEFATSDGSVHALSLLLCMSFVSRLGYGFFADGHGQFPLLNSLLLTSQTATNRADRILPLVGSSAEREARRVKMLEDHFQEVISALPNHGAPIEVESIEIEPMLTEDQELQGLTRPEDGLELEGLMDQIISPFLSLLAQKPPPTEKTLAACLLVGPVGFHIFRLITDPEQEEDTADAWDDEETPVAQVSRRAVFVVLRPNKVTYYWRHAPQEGCTITVCTNLDSLRNFIRRVLEQIVPGVSLSRTLLPHGKAMARFYSCRGQTICTNAEANYGLCLETLAEENEDWCSNSGGDVEGLQQTHHATPVVPPPGVTQHDSINHQRDSTNDTQGSPTLNLDPQLEELVNPGNQARVGEVNPDVAREATAAQASSRAFARQNGGRTTQTRGDDSSDLESSTSPIPRVLTQQQREALIAHLESDDDSDSLSTFSGLRRRSTIPLPSFITRHPHNAFFAQHHGTSPWWSQYELIPFPVEGDEGAEVYDDSGEDLAQRVELATGVLPPDTDLSCALCLQNINTADDVAVSNRCEHNLHSTCCRNWFASEAFPKDDYDNDSNRRCSLSELVPMGPCPSCRTVGRWKDRHNNRFIPNGKPVYGIHKFYAINYTRGVALPGNLSRCVHIHSPQLYEAIDSGGAHMSPSHNLHLADRTTNMNILHRKLGYKMYVWSQSIRVHSCCKCKRDRPWTSLYKWNDCEEWCHAVKCMDCCTADQAAHCPICCSYGSLQDHRGSPFARNTRRNPRQNSNDGSR